MLRLFAEGGYDRQTGTATSNMQHVTRRCASCSASHSAMCDASSRIRRTCRNLRQRRQLCTSALVDPSLYLFVKFSARAKRTCGSWPLSCCLNAQWPPGIQTFLYLLLMVHLIDTDVNTNLFTSLKPSLPWKRFEIEPSYRIPFENQWLKWQPTTEWTEPLANQNFKSPVKVEHSILAHIMGQGHLVKWFRFKIGRKRTSIRAGR